MLLFTSAIWLKENELNFIMIMILPIRVDLLQFCLVTLQFKLMETMPKNQGGDIYISLQAARP